MESTRKHLNAVGFWKNSECRVFPRPQWFVKSGWHSEDLPQIVNYLRSGKRLVEYMGYSHCRFQNCTTLTSNGTACMGSADLSDGEWVWPEGLAHYVESHEVILPEEFISTMKVNNWQVPTQIQQYNSIDDTLRAYNASLWINWAKSHKPRSWLTLFSYWKAEKIGAFRSNFSQLSTVEKVLLIPMLLFMLIVFGLLYLAHAGMLYRTELR